MAPGMYQATHQASQKIIPNLQNVMGHNTDPRAQEWCRYQGISSSMTAINAKT